VAGLGSKPGELGLGVDRWRWLAWVRGCGGFEARPWTASRLSHRAAAANWSLSVAEVRRRSAPEPRSLV